MELRQAQWTGGPEFYFTQFDAKGELLSDVGRQLDLALTAEKRKKLLRGGLPLEPTIEMKDTCGRIRVIIRDMRSGAIGTLAFLVTRERSRF
jgi:hypothetical protein